MYWLNQSFLVLLVDVSVKSLALSLLAVMVLTVLRVRNANVRHRVWTAVLLGMLALPLLVPVTPTVPIPSWLTPDFSVGQSAVNSAANAKHIASAAPAGIAPLTMPSSVSHERPFVEKTLLAQKSVPIEAAESETTAARLTTTGTATKPLASLVYFLRTDWRPLAGTVYLAVSSIFLIRLLIGFSWSRRIVARSKKLQLAQQNSPAGVRVSTDLRVPLTVGFLRPKILLPADWNEWGSAKLAAVLAHESAHVRRKDYLVTLLAEVNRAIHWFHPLAWLLRKRLAELAEQNCDDAVIASTGERTQYARHLLEVASSLRDNRGRLAWSGVAMARKANVETRIDAILDAKRPLARRIGLAGAVLLVATAAPVVLLAAALRPVTRESAAISTTETEDIEQNQVANKDHVPDEIEGQVLRPNGQPLQGAIVYSATYQKNEDALSRRPDSQWFHVIRPVSISEDAVETQINLQLTPAMERSIAIVDTVDQPIRGVKVLGRTFPGDYEEPLADNSVIIAGLSPGIQRVVCLLHEEKKLGKALLLEPTTEPRTVKLEPCATVTGRLVDEDGDPIPGRQVVVHLNAGIDNWGRTINQAKTAKDGSFFVLIPSGLEVSIFAASIDGPRFSAKCEPLAGATYNLGDLPDGTRLEKEETATKTVVESKNNDFTDALTAFDRSVTEALNDAKPNQSKTRIKGQVLGPDGIGRAGAVVYVVSTRLNHLMHPVQETVHAKTIADSQGRFDFQVNLPQRDGNLDGSTTFARIEQIVATAEGHGSATSHVIDIRAGKDVTLKLPRAHSVQGQILSLEGQPVAGATVRVLSASTPYQDIEKTLARLRAEAKQKPGYYSAFVPMYDWSESTVTDRFHNERILTKELRYPSVGLPPQVRTDQQGRFTFDGISADRMIALELSGPNIVTTWLSAVSREMEPINKAYFSGCRTNVTYGAKINYSAEPSQLIQGTLTDIITGKPLTNFRVETGRHESGYVLGKTDAEGKYQLMGAPKRKSHRLEVTPPDDQPYFRRGIKSEEAADGLAPLVIDAQLKPTQWIQGQVTDKATGQPVAARVVYVPHAENKLVADYPALLRLRGRFIHPLEREMGATRLGETAPDGTFRLPAIPGEGLVVAMATDPKYCVGIGKDQLPSDWLATNGGYEFVNTVASINPQWMNAMRRVDLTDNENSTIDLQVESGESLVLKLTDNAGEPLTGVVVKGQHAMSFGMEHPLETDHATIFGINKENPRSVLFYHRGKNIGAYLLADGNYAKNLNVIQLQPCGTLKGRLLGSKGKPKANYFLAIRAVESPNKELFPIGRTDDEGRFETTSFLPNTKFSLFIQSHEQEMLREEITLQPGETLDLGDLESAGKDTRIRGFQRTP